jgi:signal transduction histidine kinase
LQGIIVAQNKAADHILALPEGVAVGYPVGSVLRTEAECPVVTALRSQRDFTSYEFYARTAAGELKLLGLTTSRLCDANGQMRGVIASFTDLTEMFQMRQELQRQDRMAVIGELAAGLAHEIRNPVAVIRGAVDELESSIGAPDLAKRLAAIAIRESDHLNEIVSGFLDFARNPVVRRETIDLHEVLTDVAETLRRECPPNGPHIHCLSPDTPCRVSGDPSQIRQVFVNLGKNSIEAMQPDGALTFRILVPRQGPIQVRVEDDGPGIDPDKLTRIFEPFYTTKENGVGMGLAVCARIITAHDGTIRASMREGGGTSMTVSLPAARAHTIAVPVAAQPA